MIPLTFLDLNIAKVTYHYSDLYGKIFEIIGVIPTCMMGVFFSVANLQTQRIARKKILSVLLSVFSMVFFTGFTLFSISHLDRRWVIPMGIFSALFLLFSFFANRALSQKAD